MGDGCGPPANGHRVSLRLGNLLWLGENSDFTTLENTLTPMSGGLFFGILVADLFCFLLFYNVGLTQSC